MRATDACVRGPDIAHRRFSFSVREPTASDPPPPHTHTRTRTRTRSPSVAPPNVALQAFKIIPSLKNWEEILFLTEPDGWSAAAMYEATRIFTSNLNAAMAQRFFNLVLLPRIRDDILDTKKLNFHL
jgi:hypothetical protein